MQSFPLAPAEAIKKHREYRVFLWKVEKCMDNNSIRRDKSETFLSIQTNFLIFNIIENHLCFKHTESID